MEVAEIKKLTDDFKQLTVKHDKQEVAKKKIEFVLDYGANVSLVVLAGPSGVGKSTLLDRLVDGCMTKNKKEMDANPALVPILYTTAVASGHKAFDFKRMFSDGLKALKDPFVEYRTTNKRVASASSMVAGESRSGSFIREGLEAEMQARGTLVWIIDEAHHVVRGGKSGHPGDQYDVLKSFSQTTGVKLVLCGTYDLPQFLASSGQLSRRSETVAFSRYRWDDEQDLKEFKTVIHNILRRLPLESVPSVSMNAKYFYVYSCGCIGICKDWIARAFALALQEGSKSLELDHLKRTALSSGQLETIGAEMAKGEAFLAQAEPDSLDEGFIKRLMGGTLPRSGKPSPPASKPSVTKPKPGMRKPGRDAVGEPEAAA
jgi:energy-coupling factor transporter ATP-binding protein EcfA2